MTSLAIVYSAPSIRLCIENWITAPTRFLVGQVAYVYRTGKITENAKVILTSTHTYDKGHLIPLKNEKAWEQTVYQRIEQQIEKELI